jgi:hypothetical protein
MKTEICFDCYRIMERRKENVDEKIQEYWICESCGKRKHK